MTTSRMGPRQKLLLAFGTITLLAATVLATQTNFFTGPLVPFANPSDSATNDVLLFESSLPHNTASPWHYHTGDLYAVVRQGTLIEDLGCGRAKEFPAGTALHDPPFVVHQLRNAAEQDVQAAQFQVFHRGDPPFVVTSEPTCP